VPDSFSREALTLQPVATTNNIIKLPRRGVPNVLKTSLKRRSEKKNARPAFHRKNFHINLLLYCFTPLIAHHAK
jgi:hypothetical protein